MVHSLLRHASGPVALHVLTHDLTGAEAAPVRETVDLFPGSSLTIHRLESEVAEQDYSIPYMRPVTFARLQIPQLMSGRVLYLDVDALVAGDVHEIARTDLGDAVAAAVRDFGTVEQLARLSSRDPKDTRRARRLRAAAQEFIDRTRAALGRDDLSGYFNAGLVLLDCDRIRAEPDLLSAFGDAAAASKLPLLDQDWLNIVLAGRVAILAPEWNSVWGNALARRYPFTGALAERYETSRRAPRFIHYAGPLKPWQPFRTRMVRRGNLRAFLAYRLAEARWRRDLRRGRVRP